MFFSVFLIIVLSVVALGIELYIYIYIVYHSLLVLFYHFKWSIENLTLFYVPLPSSIYNTVVSIFSTYIRTFLAQPSNISRKLKGERKAYCNYSYFFLLYSFFLPRKEDSPFYCFLCRELTSEIFLVEIRCLQILSFLSSDNFLISHFWSIFLWIQDFVLTIFFSFFTFIK